MNLLPYDTDRLWIKARLFVHRAMDLGREFEEQAFWASAAFELLGKAALARVSPILIANPNPDGHSVLVASGLLNPDEKFSTIPAHTLWSRCRRSFKPFNESEALYISAVRNDYLHAGTVGKEGTPEAWWPRYWAQVAILVSHLDREMVELVGATGDGIVSAYLVANREGQKRRLEALLERARTRLALHESGGLSAALERAWDAFTPYSMGHTTSAECPACGATGTITGDSKLDSRAEHSMVRYGGEEYDEITIWDSIASEAFSCDHCHLELNEFDLLEAAGLDESFEVEGDPEAYYDEPEYNNE